MGSRLTGSGSLGKKLEVPQREMSTRGELEWVIAETGSCAKLLPDNLFTFRYLRYNVF